MKVVLSKTAQKHFHLLPESEKKKIKRNLVILKDTPLAGKKLEGELSESRSLRSWPYRIIYTINLKDKIIEASDILHRQGTYK